ncbi:MAG: hydrogenase formation protein HypD [Armatimonadetes bacterium]|nr:hydrogenase formation protein HypD [Armatimonadota bacterium]
MKYVEEFRDPDTALRLADAIRRALPRPMRLMEVCGTHTMAIARSGIRRLLPDSLRLVSGPGCPVCVTSQTEIDRFIEMGRSPDTILATFGDMIRVPGSRVSLEQVRAMGADVRVVYSPLDAVTVASENPDRRVLFFGIGFETTAPAVALSILEADKAGLDNYLVLAAHKTIPQAMSALSSDPEVAVDGFICPGHVTSVIGSRAYEPIASKCGIPCVVAGFEPLDILQAVLMLVRQAAEGRSEVEVQYSRAVSGGGNPAALRCIREVFRPCDAEWRGLGVIPGSGLRLRSEFAAYDASRSGVQLPADRQVGSGECECGAILKGLKSPRECAAFGKPCRPERPLGPCMVSSEGACAAEYRYSDVEVTP